MAEQIVVGDFIEQNVEQISSQQTEENNYSTQNQPIIQKVSEKNQLEDENIIGYLTIPDILLKNAPIQESTELATLSNAIGHFTSTSIYSGNVGLASHNSGGKGDFFKNLKDIKIGSKIYYQTQYGTKKYTVTFKQIISETDLTYLRKTRR